MNNRMTVKACAAILLACVGGGALVGGCSTAPKSDTAKADLQRDAQNAMDQMKRDDPSLTQFLNGAYGYAIFPTVGKGGLGVGGAYGHGIVYEQGRMIGYCDITQATIGLQIGGQSFKELIAFENKAALDKFTQGKFAFSANASAVAVRSGASAAARYQDGVAVFTQPNGGLMAEASVGGQKFSYTSANK